MEWYGSHSAVIIDWFNHFHSWWNPTNQFATIEVTWHWDHWFMVWSCDITSRVRCTVTPLFLWQLTGMHRTYIMMWKNTAKIRYAVSNICREDSRLISIDSKIQTAAQRHVVLAILHICVELYEPKHDSFIHLKTPEIPKDIIILSYMSISSLTPVSVSDYHSPVRLAKGPPT